MDACVLVAGLLNKPRAWVIAHPEAIISPVGQPILENAIQRLERGEPLPFILGHWEFFGLDFQLNPATLIPRPETELLVEQALEWLKKRPERRQVADVGTGSGCIAISLASQVPNLKIIATDISGQALRAAQANARTHNVSRQVSFIQTYLLEGIQVNFDLICANLPYIPTQTLASLAVHNREPNLALDGGSDGLELIKALLITAPQRLARGGRLLMEMESSQAEAVSGLAGVAFPEGDIHIIRDLAGRDRLLVVDNNSRQE